MKFVPEYFMKQSLLMFRRRIPVALQGSCLSFLTGDRGRLHLPPPVSEYFLMSVSMIKEFSRESWVPHFLSLAQKIARVQASIEMR
jgi:hypothetical protein